MVVLLRKAIDMWYCYVRLLTVVVLFRKAIDCGDIVT